MAKQELNDYAQQLERAGLPKAVFTRKEMNYLPEVIRDGEELLYAVSGMYDNNTWLVACTNSRVLLLNKGMVYGLKQVDVPLDKINAVSFKTGALFGSIEIQNGASFMKIETIDKKVVKFMADTIKSAAQDFTAKQNGGYKQAQTAAPAESTSTNLPLIADELIKLKSLVDAGVLTQDEFDTQKAKLLNK